MFVIYKKFIQKEKYFINQIQSRAEGQINFEGVMRLRGRVIILELSEVP